MRWYGLLDLLGATFYAALGFGLTPSRSPIFNLALAGVCALLAFSGLSLLTGARFGRAAGIVAAAALLLFAAAVILGLVASAAYLRGVYGAVGQGLSLVTLGVAALVLELFAILPLCQLRFLLRRA